MSATENVMKWRLCATFDATELEADGYGDMLIALLPLGAEIDLEPAANQEAQG